jgi:hypothetical protein
VLAQTTAALARADVVLVDPGDLDRASEFAKTAGSGGASRARQSALRSTDALLGTLADSVAPDTMVLVVSVTPKTARWQVTPMVVAGPGVPRGTVVSPSTKRVGLATLGDIAPTVLDALGAPIPTDEMEGHAVRYQPGHADLGRLSRLDRDARYREGIYVPVTTIYVTLQALLVLFTIFSLSRGAAIIRRGSGLRLALLSAAAFPLATFCLRAIPGITALGNLSILVVAALSIGLGVVATQFRRHPLSPLTWLMGLTAVTILADASTGTRLHTSSILGWSLQSAGRFYGIPNTTFAVLAACTLLTAAAHVHYAPRRNEAIVAAGLALGLVAYVDGAPSLGNDVGGIITLVPIFGLALYALSGRRLSWRRVGIVGAVAAVVLVGFALLDERRPPSAQTHLGQFVASLREGGIGVAFETALRKQEANLKVLTHSVWSWIVPVGAAFMLYLLVWERRFTGLLPRRSPLYIGVVGAVVASIVGFITNDSGPVVTALFFVFIVPVLALSALAADERSSVIPQERDGPPRNSLEGGGNSTTASTSIHAQ